MGGEIKTNVSDDFKALESDMTVRSEGKLPVQYVGGMWREFVPAPWIAVTDIRWFEKRDGSCS